MFLTIVDLALILVLFVFITLGYVRGFLATIGSLAGTILGFWIASSYSDALAAWLTPYMLGRVGLASTIAFAIIFIAVNQSVALGLFFATKLFNIISIIPFTKTLNRLLGGLFGAVEGIIVLTAVVFVVQRFVPFPTITDAFTQSVIASYFSYLITVSAPWHSMMWDKVKEYTPF